MKELRADLHIHTCLSPCAELEMVPTAIVRQAKAAGLDMVAICDHNSVDNTGAVARAGRRESLPVLPGIEITTREEVHLLGLFPPDVNLADLRRLMHESLSGTNDADSFGFQVVVDERDEPIELEERLLIGATSLTLEETVEAIHRLGGLAIAAHVDRQGFGLLEQLGFLPPKLELDALEVSPRASQLEWSRRWPELPVVTSSDAHRLDDIGRSFTSLLTREANFDEVALALRGQDGRRLVAHHHGRSVATHS